VPTHEAARPTIIWIRRMKKQMFVGESSVSLIAVRADL
jgi:hypothetical protein